MSISNSKIGSLLSKTKDKISSFISEVIYKPSEPLTEINSILAKNQYLKKNNTIDLYRSDYIPYKKNISNSFQNIEKDIHSNILGQKTSRTNFNEISRKINIPNDKRYHKSLLENSLDSIRNEIRQKREENIIRMNELSNKKDKLNDFFYDENNNKGKFTSIFNSNISKKINNNDDDINLDENEQNIFNSNSKNDYSNSLQENSFLDKTNLKRKFNPDFICSDINESFSINSKIKKKKIDKNMIIIQKQTEFAFKYNKEEKTSKDVKVLFGSPKEDIKSEFFSNNAIFGLKPVEKKEEKTIKNDSKEINKEPKIKFGSPKEPIISQPLSNNFSFGVKKEQKEEKKEETRNVLFGVPKESIKYEPLMVDPKFGFENKENNNKENKKEIKEEKKDKVLFETPKENDCKNKNLPLKATFTFEIKKEEENPLEQNKTLASSDNLFLNKIEDKINNNKKDSKDENNNPFINVQSKNNLFDNNSEEQSSNLFSLIPRQEPTNLTTESNFLGNEKAPVKSIFGELGLFGKKETNEDKKENKPFSLFGESKLINSTNNSSLFGDKGEKNDKDKKESLFGSSTIFNNKKNDNNKISLFGDSNINNSTSLFKTENVHSEKKHSLFEFNNDNKNNSLFGNINNDKNSTLFGSKETFNNKSLFGENNNSLFGNLNDDKNKL